MNGPLVYLNSIYCNVNLPARMAWRHRVGIVWRILVGLPVQITLPDASVTINATPVRNELL